MKALSIRNLTKTYQNGFQALKKINLDVDSGDFFALLGANGAGKSTTIGIITSLVQKTSGYVSVYGYDIDKDFSRAKAFVGVVPQEINFNIFEKCIHVLVNQAGYFGLRRKIAYQRAELYLKKLELWGKRNDSVRSLSGGMKRRLMIARSLMHQPQLLILDEPTAGVDIEIRASMWNFLKEINQSGTTIILTTHYLEEAENLCRNIAIIDQGEIIENTSMKKLLTQLNSETFVLYLSKPIAKVPAIPKYTCRLVDENTIEVDVHQDQNINMLFTQLSAQNISVLSLKNKANRLETLFLDMIDKKGGTNPQ